MFNNVEKMLKIGNKKISEDSPVFIIAEAGVNHNGDINIAKQMIDVAVDAGVDAIKFQTFKTDKLILRNVKKAPYQLQDSDGLETQYDMLKQLELSIDETRALLDYCNKKNIIFLSTPFEKSSLDELERLGVLAYKISATDITNIQFLRQIAKKNKPIIISAGMCYMEEVEKALETIIPINNKVILLQCSADYPIQDKDANIGIITTFKKKFDMMIGYSDHSQGVGASPYAVALGAKVIEKHFTLDKDMKGPDHRASVSPGELKQLVSDIRRVETYLGNGIKMPTVREYENRKALQKYIVASKKISKGEIFSDENIVSKRTNGEGIPSIYYDDIVGKMSEYDFYEDDIIKL